MRKLVLTFILTASYFMVGCGQTGPLYLPPPPPAKSANTQPTTTQPQPPKNS